MITELKIRLSDPPSIKRRLEYLGATPKGIHHSVHTYFKQPDNQVLKLVEANGRVELHRLHAADGRFIVDSIVEVEDKAVQLKDLTTTYGISRQLNMTSDGYDYHGYAIDLYDIDRIGSFLIISGEQPSTQLLSDWFDIRDPDIVRVSFDKL